MENVQSTAKTTSTEEEEISDAEYMSRVEADKRSILEQLLTFDYESLSKSGKPSTDAQKEKKTSGKPINEDNVKETLEEEYEKIFGDVDIDDSEEIFNNLLKRVEEEFKRQMDIKKKNPFLAASLSATEETDLKPERRSVRKRKPAKFEQSLKLMDNFKKQMLEKPTEPNKLQSSSSDFSSTSALVKSSRNGALVNSKNSSNKLKSSLKFYPKWKTTSTYTPIFSAPTNPNWASIPTTIEEKKELQSQKTANKNKMLTSMPCFMPTPNELGLPRTMNFSKMYTSSQIRNWIHSYSESGDNHSKANNDAQLLSSSSKTFRSDQSVCNSEFKNDVLSSPMGSPLDTSTPVRDTVVRFRPSPPQCFVFSADGDSNVSSSPPVIDYENNNVESNDFNDYEFLPQEFVYCENENANEQAGDDFNPNYSDDSDDCPENYNPVKQPADHRDQKPFFNFNERYLYSCCNGRHYNETNAHVLNNNSRPPVPSADFVRNLKYNININYNIINNYKS